MCSPKLLDGLVGVGVVQSVTEELLHHLSACDGVLLGYTSCPFMKSTWLLFISNVPLNCRSAGGYMRAKTVSGVIMSQLSHCLLVKCVLAG